MPRNSTELEQAVSRTLRDSLEKLQRTTDELNQAVSDLTSACASSRPANSLPSMLCAQTAAASLSASLEALIRFVTGALNSAYQPSGELEEPEPPEAPAAPTPKAAAAAPTVVPQPPETVPQPPASKKVEEAPAHTATKDVPVAPAASRPSVPVAAAGPFIAPPTVGDFDFHALPSEERDLHRRADRLAKVAMQDIKMLRPEQVNVGKERKDLCSRLSDDIDKARKEYDRRFQALLDKPVDYFYNRMVEILGDGDPSTLGDYPYPSALLRR
jgi:hypothetical protein